MLIRWIQVKEYASLWGKSDKAIYARIKTGKLKVKREPDGGQIVVPVCDCFDNYFPGRTLCDKHKAEVEVEFAIL